MSINGIYALYFKRSVVDQIGGNLSRIKHQFCRLGIRRFSEFAAFVNRLRPEDLKDMDNGEFHIEDL